MRHPILTAALYTSLLTAACCASAQPVPGADPVGLRGDISGSWFDPAQSGHGVMIEVLPGGTAAVTWFTFDPSGAPMWLVGLGDIDGSSIRVPVQTLAGGRFPPQFDSANTARTPWGELLIAFDGCNSGTLSWTPTAAGFSSGSMPLARLTGIDGLRCNATEEFSETRTLSFERGAQGFGPLFADLPPDEDEFYELDFAHEALPAPLDARRGPRITGNNHSDDLAMLITGPVHGLQADTVYAIELEMEMASNVPTGCSGIGGSPGDSVYMKLGATGQAPAASTAGQPDGWLRLNFDYGQQAEGGSQAPVVGTLANTQDCEVSVDGEWELKTLTTRGTELRARTDADGTLWAVAGSDSAFEGATSWYLTRLTLHLDPVEGDPLR